MSINNIESYNKAQLIETLEIAQQEYRALAKANAELTERAEKAERERDDALSRLARLHNEFYACARCGYGFDCKDFDIFTIDRDASALNKFALQQKIEGIESVIVALKNRLETMCDRNSEVLVEALIDDLRRHCDQLRKQLEGE